MIGLDYVDTVTLVKPKTGSNGYATEVVDEIGVVGAIFVQSTGQNRGPFREDVTSTATVYLDPYDEFVLYNCNRLEGMYIIAPTFGSDTSSAWYKISAVRVGQDKLLGNQVDNIECDLTKSVELPS